MKSVKAQIIGLRNELLERDRFRYAWARIRNQHFRESFPGGLENEAAPRRDSDGNPIWEGDDPGEGHGPASDRDQP